MRVTGFDHLVLTVASIERTADFYERVLGMTREVFGPERRTALRFGPHKINLHEQGREFEPKAEAPTPGSADLCFLVEGFGTLRATLRRKGSPSSLDRWSGPARAVRSFPIRSAIRTSI